MRGRSLGVSRSLAGWFASLACAAALAGCSTTPPGDDGVVVDVQADSMIIRGAAAEAKAASDGRPYEFRAVCMEATKHPQSPFVISKWGEDIAVARDLGHYHADWKAKGHHWVIQRRIKQAHS